MQTTNKYLYMILMIVTLLAVSACASTADKSSTGEYFDDTVITTKVKTAIMQDPDLKVSEINVETYKGVVQLSGFVSSRAHITRAIEVARGVPGVKSVKNSIALR